VSTRLISGFGFVAAAFALTIGLSAQKPRVDLRFSPQSDTFAAASKEYQAIWAAEGDKMISAIERVSGLKFRENRVQVTVFEGVSRSGGPGSPMMMRASYPADTKKATLVHELGHRHLSQVKVRPLDVDDHKLLFLVLFDIWVDLYGEQFANEQANVEKQRRGIYDYEAAWNWALALDKDGRAARFQEILKRNARK
jgi:hypothetical protein